ncbi:MAG: biotin/lipoyl-binding protein [Dysgonamonadaceae bacterium]|jgi:biotin carboxyl carrier protein|nr:biotin/lipoyl-binding protein [Dysgonamonadaceae bacterium]
MKRFSFNINGGNYRVTVKSLESGVADIEVNGTPYSVVINKVAENTAKNLTAPAPSAAKSTVVTTSVPAAKTAGKIKSPLPGNVIKVNVAAGSSFKEGDVLMTIESMKMENNVLAETSGTITKVCALAGQAVLQDETLFEYETSGSATVNQVIEKAPVTAPAPKPAPAPKQAAVAPAPAASSDVKKIKSPLPGNIIKVNVAAGQAFKNGDVLCIMESMKMENNILAETDGVLSKICVSAGQAVLQDEVLFEYE